jgi:hypothetical protein
MAVVRVMVAESSRDVLATVVAEKIRREGFELVCGRVVASDELGELLSDPRIEVDVIVVIGGDAADSLRKLLERRPKLLTSHISVGSDSVHLNLKRVGLSQLLGAMRALTTQAAGEIGVFEVVRREAENEAIWLLAREWIDATVRYSIEAQPAGDNSLPGLTRSQLSIQSLFDDQSERRTAQPVAAEAFGALERACRQEFAANSVLTSLHRCLNLTATEFRALLLCAAPELDPKYQSAYGYLHDDLGRRAASLGLVCSLLGEPVQIRRELGSSGGIVDWRLLDHGDSLPHGDEAMRLEGVVADWLLGDREALLRDLRSRRLIRSSPWIGSRWLRQPADTESVQNISRILTRSGCDGEWLILAGADTDGWRALVEKAAGQSNLSLLRVSLSAWAAMEPTAARESAIRIARAVRLLNLTPVVDTADCAERGPEALSRLIEGLGVLPVTAVMVVSDLERMIGSLPQRKCLVLNRPRPDAEATGAAFAAAAAESGISLSPDEAVRIGTSFPLPLSGIDDAVRLTISAGVKSEGADRYARALKDASRRVAAPNLPQFARRIDPVVELSRVVLPPDRFAQLEEIPAHVEYATKVMGSWGFGSQRMHTPGCAALFCGPSGTGKTMAAQAVAKALNTHLYQVDLSKVQSKYIGESEKHLDAVFTEAQRAAAVLLFDEADALFGKRSEVKDAHDRYANMEVAYLLQRIEEYAGLAILTTNFRQNLDQAFLRRLRFVIEFPKPDTRSREKIWEQCLQPPAPKGADIDFEFLARRLELTGGNISQITLRAAFLAAKANSPNITMAHLVAASRAELLKIGLPSAERELAEYEAARQAAAQRAAAGVRAA